MGQFISNFNTTAELEAFSATTAFSAPHVSLTKDDGKVHFMPPETRIVAKFNVTDTSSSTQLCYSNAVSQFSEIEIDGAAQPSVVSTYTFSTTGEHTVKYTLTDPTSIGTSAFMDCTSLTSVTIPNSVTSIGASAFRSTSLTSVTIPNSVTSIENKTFLGCSGLTSVTIGNSVTSIGTSAFRSTSLTSVTIGNSVTSIGEGAFDGCISLTSVTIGNSVTSIGEGAFYGCSGLTSVTIPNNVTSIGKSVFRTCVELNSIISNAMIAPTITSNTFRDVKTGGTLRVPIGSSGYDVWMGTSDYYLGKYNWTKVEQ